MIRIPLIPILLSLAAATTSAAADRTRCVDPFIGTGGHGHTYPGATLPFGMVQLSPDTRLEGWDGCSGYHYSDDVIYGFSHTHLSGTGVPDVTSGFRALTREAALRINIVSEFSYTLESIIQAGKQRMAIAHVPISTNPRTRDSRLFDSAFSYVKKSAATIVRIYAMYEPLKVFTYIGLLVFATGVAISVRFLYYYFTETGLGHLQSLILSAVLMIVGFQVMLIGLLADVISGNRKLIEDLLYRVRSMELARGEPERPLAGAAKRPDRWES